MEYFETIIAVSDLQIPFHHPDAFDFLRAVKAKYYISPRRTKVINQGDEVDQHGLGKWVKDPDGMSAGHEHKKSLDILKEYWEIFPEQDICISNHTWRIYRKAKEAGIPKAFIRDIYEFMGAPEGVRWAQNWIYNEVLFEHGENVSGVNAAFNAAVQNGMSTSIGHQHLYGGVKFVQKATGLLFGLNTGCLIDINAYAFEYQTRARLKPTLGCGVIIEKIGYFIPMILNKEGRWIGRLVV